MMAEQMNNVPALRFTEFDGSWEEKRLGDVASISRGRFSPRPRNDPKFYGGEIPFVQTSDITNSNGRVNSYTQTLNEHGLQVSKLFPKGAILITIAANIGYSGLLEIDMACPDSLIGIICGQSIYNEFLNHYLITQQARMDYLAPEAAQKNINIEFLVPYKVPTTTIEEQTKIASFLTSVDTRIQQVEEKKRLLTEYKKGVMQQIFSQQIRFKDDNGNAYPDWEEKLLGEVFDIKKGEQINRDELSQISGFPVMNGGVSPSGYHTESNRKNGTIAISEGGNSCGFITLMKADFWSGGHCYTIHAPKLQNKFLFQALKHNERYIQKLRVGGALPNIQKKDILRFKVFVPKEYDEQQKIADSLTAIDSKIEQVSSQLAQAKAFKKGLLQQMFV